MDDVGVTYQEEKKARYSIEDNRQIIRYGRAGFGAHPEIEGTKIIYTGYAFGGVSEDGVVAKRKIYTAYCDFVTGEHGKLE
jgi:hypothetical protein